MTRRHALTAAAGLMILAAGCGPGEPAIPKRTPVSGTVLVRGRAVAGVRVVFHPQFDIGPVKFMPGGTTDKEGRFRLSSRSANDGAPAGRYAVTFTWPEPSKNPEEGDLQVDRWKNKYNDPATSKWTVTVTESTAELEPFLID